MAWALGCPVAVDYLKFVPVHRTSERRQHSLVIDDVEVDVPRD